VVRIGRRRREGEGPASSPRDDEESKEQVGLQVGGEVQPSGALQNGVPAEPLESPEPLENPELLMTPEPLESGGSTAASIGEIEGASERTGEVRAGPPDPVSSRSARGDEIARSLLENSEGRGVSAFRPLPRVIAVANQKGGVGKTTTTVNLGAALAEMGYRTLVVDLDPQGNATTGLGIDARNFEYSMYDVIMHDTALEDAIEPTSVRNLFVAPATIDLAGVEIELVPAFSRELRVRRAVETVLEDFDFVLIDCPPSLGLITVNGLAAASEVLVPIQCEYYALEGLGQLLRNVHLVASNLNDRLEVSAIVLTMYDARTRLAVDVAAEVREHFGDKVCRIVIPRTIRLSEAPSFGQPITVFDPASRGAVAYRELAKEVSNGAAQRAG
jgi:chromosome partitioning protein